jgi:hypothetical protein
MHPLPQRLTLRTSHDGPKPSIQSVGTWRSLVAHLHGVQGVGGSNPLVPTNPFSGLALTEFPLGEASYRLARAGRAIPQGFIRRHLH